MSDSDKQLIRDLIEAIEANSDELINLALVPGGPCIKSIVLKNSDQILESCNSLKNFFEKKL